ncbi:MAG: LptF/LptG family permease [Candidatus Omnitrophica bacterium]|nr:LptF/LptG family permease [Candidatus Omnitrophota bacterium]MBU4590938.1 LptF/LptG family permease [Candidatus Omnitrophota bacterium]
MRILDRYIIKNFLMPFFYCLSLFVFLYIIIDLFGHLDEILKNKVPILILQEYYLSMVPFIILHTAPVASLISTIYVISAMNKHDEIIAMRASGINIFRILTPFISIGIAISISIFAVSEKIVPMAMKNAHAIKENYIEKEKKGEAENKKTINNIAMYGKGNRLIFIESYDMDTSTAKGITLLEQDKTGNVGEKINAQEGKWTGVDWELSNLLIYKLDEKGKIEGNPSFFESKNITIESPKELISKGTNYEFMSFRDLSNYINNFSNASPEIINKLRVDLHQKISFPFMSLVIILIGSGFAIKVKRRGKTAAIVGMGMGIVLGFVYYALMATFIALGKGGILPAAISAHLANIIFGSLGLVLIRN